MLFFKFWQKFSQNTALETPPSLCSTAYVMMWPPPPAEGLLPSPQRPSAFTRMIKNHPGNFDQFELWSNFNKNILRYVLRNDGTKCQKTRKFAIDFKLHIKAAINVTGFVSVECWLLFDSKIVDKSSRKYGKPVNNKSITDNHSITRLIAFSYFSLDFSVSETFVGAILFLCLK